MSTMTLLLIYCVLILMASLAGGLLPLLVRLTHQRLQLAISLVAGIMLGVGLLHMLPHALAEASGRSDLIMLCVLGGFLTMFFLERFFCFHHHDVPPAAVEQVTDAHQHAAEKQRHDHGPSGGHSAAGHLDVGAHRLGWIGASIGLTLHTLIAGIALAASIAAESTGEYVTAIAGFGTFLAIFLHKPFDAMTITTLMTLGGWSRPMAHLVNGLFALVVPVGAILFLVGVAHAGEGANPVPYALAFSAGTFLCIAMSDLLPELQFHRHDRFALSLSLLLGLSIVGGVSLLESTEHGHEGHAHSLVAAELDDAHGHDQHGVRDDHGVEGAHAGEARHDDHDPGDAHRHDAPAAMQQDHSTDAPGSASQDDRGAYGDHPE